jgi:hypothetical protein
MVSHFIETNILIGHTVNWDNQSAGVSAYLNAVNADIFLSTSIRAVNEAKKVITDRRRPTVQAARLVFEGFEANTDRPSQSDIIGFLRPKLDYLRDAVRSHVFSYVEHQIDMFRGLATEESSRVLRLTIGDISDDFNKAIDVIDDIAKGRASSFKFHVYNCCPDSYDGVYPVFNTIDSILDESPNDRDLILDAFHLKVEDEIHSPVYFVTTDYGDILSNGQLLSDTLPGIEFRKPSSFV